MIRKFKIFLLILITILFSSLTPCFAENGRAATSTYTTDSPWYIIFVVMWIVSRAILALFPFIVFAVYRKSAFLRPDKIKMIVFLAILMIANIPGVGTTGVMEGQATCLMTDSISGGCSPVPHYREARYIFFWPACMMADLHQIHMDTDDGTGIPIIHIADRILRFWNTEDILGLMYNMLYFYVVSCATVLAYRRIRNK